MKNKLLSTAGLVLCICAVVNIPQESYAQIKIWHYVKYEQCIKEIDSAILVMNRDDEKKRAWYVVLEGEGHKLVSCENGIREEDAFPNNIYFEKLNERQSTPISTIPRLKR